MGEDGYDVLEYEDSVTDEEIDEDVWLMAVQHAESYGHELCSSDCEDEDCEYEHIGSTNIEGSWELYDEYKHEGYF